MSSTPTGRSADIQRLVTAGDSIQIRQNHLLMHDVPYVDESRQVRRGTLVTPLTLAGNITTAPSDHIADSIGAAPCTWQGSPMTALNHSGIERTGPRVAHRPELLEQVGNPVRRLRAEASALRGAPECPGRRDRPDCHCQDGSSPTRR